MISLTSGQASYRRLRYCPGFNLRGICNSKRSFEHFLSSPKAKLPCEYACALNCSHSLQSLVLMASQEIAPNPASRGPSCGCGQCIPHTATLFMRIAHRGHSISGELHCANANHMSTNPNAGTSPHAVLDALGYHRMSQMRAERLSEQSVNARNAKNALLKIEKSTPKHGIIRGTIPTSCLCPSRRLRSS